MPKKKELEGEKGQMPVEEQVRGVDKLSTLHSKPSKPKKELVLRLPDKIFKIIKKFKDTSGIPYTHFILNAIIWYLFMKGLISLKYLREEEE